MKTRFVFGRVIAPAAIALVAALPAAAEPNMDKYNKSCAMCHNGALPMAPKTHDAKAWEPRLAKGMDALLASVKNGLNAMPATGMCSDCTDEEYKALIKYMSTPQ